MADSGGDVVEEDPADQDSWAAAAASARASLTGALASIPTPEQEHPPRQGEGQALSLLSPHPSFLVGSWTRGGAGAAHGNMESGMSHGDRESGILFAAVWPRGAGALVCPRAAAADLWRLRRRPSLGTRLPRFELGLSRIRGAKAAQGVCSPLRPCSLAFLPKADGGSELQCCAAQRPLPAALPASAPCTLLAVLQCKSLHLYLSTSSSAPLPLMRAS